jgi:transposase
MSTSTTNPGDEQRQAGLFGEDELPVRTAPPRGDEVRGAARVMRAQRDQLELRACDLDALLGPDHPARTVWAFVQSLDLAPLYARIKSVEGAGGAPAIDPAILVSLWLWATIDGVGSAREVDRLCESEDAYRWLCGGVGVNYHTLARFRTEQAAWLDAQLTRSIASLMDRGLVELNVVAQDGMRVRAAAKAASFRRKSRLQRLHATARAQVEALKQELEADASASNRRKQAARERAAREREQRLAQALHTLQEIERLSAPKKPAVARPDQDEPPDSSAKAKTPPAPRVSTTDAEARVMKMADGGFRPAFNAQLAVDVDTQLIAAVDVVNAGSDMGQMAPMHDARPLARRRGFHQAAGDRGAQPTRHPGGRAAAGQPQPTHRPAGPQTHGYAVPRAVASVPADRPRQGPLPTARCDGRMRQRPAATTRAAAVQRSRPGQGARRAVVARARS